MSTVARIKQIAKRKKRSMAYLCAEMNVARVYFNDIEKTGRQIPPDKLQIIADALDVSVDYLVGNTDTESGERARVIELPDMLNDRERSLVAAYRAQPEMQAAVDRLLGIETISVYMAAQDDTKFDGMVEITREKWEQIKNAPDDDEPLL